MGFELPSFLGAVMAAAPGATDLLLAVGRPPQTLSGGTLTDAAVEGIDRLTPFQTETVVQHLLAMAPASAAQRIRECGAAHFAYSVPGVSRFRVAVFSQRGTFTVALRTIPESVPSLADLRLPGVLARACEERQGIILVAGPAGSGRTTTMAAMIGEINRSRPCHVVTVEDPIELLHRHAVATVNQKEVGTDTPSLARGLADSLRQGAQVLVSSEVSSREEALLLLEAAETGHLVLTTVRARDTASAVGRLVSLVPAEQCEALYGRLARTLRWCFTQKILPHRDGRRPVVEVWRWTPEAAAMIAEGRLDPAALATFLQGSAEQGMIAFDHELERRVRGGELGQDVAVSEAILPGDLKARLAGLGEAAR